MTLDWLDEELVLTQSFSLEGDDKVLNETQLKGLTTELQCQLFFTQLGYNVSIPIAQDCRYDMILDINSKLYKIQIKTSRPNENGTGGLIFNTVSSRMNHSEGNIKVKYSSEDVDFFGTYFNNKVYLVPIELCQSSEKRLVENRSTSNQVVDFLQDYEAQKVIDRIINNKPLSVREERKVVEQYTLEGEFVNSFNSYMDAARSLGITSTTGSTHISEVVRGLRNSAYGFKWKKVEK